MNDDINNDIKSSETVNNFNDNKNESNIPPIQTLDVDLDDTIDYDLQTYNKSESEKMDSENVIPSLKRQRSSPYMLQEESWNTMANDDNDDWIIEKKRKIDAEPIVKINDDGTITYRRNEAKELLESISIELINKL